MASVWCGWSQPRLTACGSRSGEPGSPVSSSRAPAPPAAARAPLPIVGSLAPRAGSRRGGGRAGTRAGGRAAGRRLASEGAQHRERGRPAELRAPAVRAMMASLVPPCLHTACVQPTKDESTRSASGRRGGRRRRAQRRARRGGRRHGPAAARPRPLAAPITLNRFVFLRQMDGDTLLVSIKSASTLSSVRECVLFHRLFFFIE